MAIRITEDCIVCGACEEKCPNRAIFAGEGIYEVDPELCTECVGFSDHAACQAACPVECCLPDPERSEPEQVLLQRALLLHPEDAVLRARAQAGDYPSRLRSSSRPG
jgi:ferredoxin